MCDRETEVPLLAYTLAIKSSFCKESGNFRPYPRELSLSADIPVENGNITKDRYIHFYHLRINVYAEIFALIFNNEKSYYLSSK